MYVDVCDGEHDNRRRVVAEFVTKAEIEGTSNFRIRTLSVGLVLNSTQIPRNSVFAGAMPSCRAVEH